MEGGGWDTWEDGERQARGLGEGSWGAGRVPPASAGRWGQQGKGWWAVLDALWPSELACPRPPDSAQAQARSPGRGGTHGRPQSPASPHAEQGSRPASRDAFQPLGAICEGGRGSRTGTRWAGSVGLKCHKDRATLRPQHSDPHAPTGLGATPGGSGVTCVAQASICPQGPPGSHLHLLQDLQAQLLPPAGLAGGLLRRGLQEGRRAPGEAPGLPRLPGEGAARGAGPPPLWSSGRPRVLLPRSCPWMAPQSPC